MGLKSPRGKYERLDVVLPAKIWRTPKRADTPVAATCRNLSAHGCRLIVEDVKLIPGVDLDHSIGFALKLLPTELEVRGAGQVAWIKKEHGESDKIRVVLGIQYTSVSFQDRERIKSFIIIKGTGTFLPEAEPPSKKKPVPKK